MGDLLQNSALTIGFVAAIVTGLGVIWLKFVKPSFRNLRAGIRSFQRVVRAADRLLPFAEQQLQSDGGSTFKDQIDRIDTEVKGISLRFEEFVGDTRTVQDKTLAAASAARIAADAAAALVEARHREMRARLTTIEKHLEPSGLPVPVTITDGPVPVTIVEEEKP